ncbi:MAG: hypothetical protein PUE10_06270 [Bacteroidales bacterium]|nr:hypothetical protein [Bacteroidales bacterium]
MNITRTASAITAPVARAKYIIILCLVAALALPAGAQRRKAAKSKAKPSLETLFDNADQALVMYDTDALSETIDEIADRLDSSRKPSADDTERLRQLRNRQLALGNMLGRVQQLVIVDSATVSLDSMLTRYALSADAGTLRADTGLVSFTPAGNREVFFTQRDDDGLLHIMAADIPDNGVPEKARQLKLFDDPDVQTAWPFLMADGTTLYFASDADSDGALGGWDIYMTRRDETGNFLEPTNIGMPYNSTGDDMMLVVDEYAGLGYWATDRNAGDGDVTVFTFIPAFDARVNYSADRPDISDLAYITSVKATWPEGFDARAVLDKAARARQAHSAAPDKGSGFVLSLGDGRVCTDPSQLRSPQAKTLVDSYIRQTKALADAESRLAQLRAQYGSDKSVAGQIRSLEQQLPALRTRVKAAANDIIKAEKGR